MLLLLGMGPGLNGQALYSLTNRRVPMLDAPVFDGSGNRLNGTNYLAELYGGPTPDALSPAVFRFVPVGWIRLQIPFRSGVASGYFGAATGGMIEGVAGYDFAWLQVRAWDARLGATYEEVAARGLGGYGESPLFYAQGGFAFDQFPQGLLLLGLQSFSLRPAQGVLMRSIAWEEDRLVVEWHPGFPKYQIQQRSSLDEPWENLGEPTSATRLVVDEDGAARFIRVIGLLESS